MHGVFYLFVKWINSLWGSENTQNRRNMRSWSVSDEVLLTGICHGEAIPHFDHIHLRHQFGDVLVLREGETKNLIFVRFCWEQSSCWAAKKQELKLDSPNQEGKNTERCRKPNLKKETNAQVRVRNSHLYWCYLENLSLNPSTSPVNWCRGWWSFAAYFLLHWRREKEPKSKHRFVRVWS